MPTDHPGWNSQGQVEDQQGFDLLIAEAHGFADCPDQGGHIKPHQKADEKGHPGKMKNANIWLLERQKIKTRCFLLRHELLS